MTDQQQVAQPSSSHFIPKIWRPQGTRDFIYFFFADHLNTKSEKHLEIEIRLGRFTLVPNKRVNPDQYAKMMRDISVQNPVIVGCTYQPIKKKLGMKSNTFLKEVSHRFSPQVPEGLFMSRLQLIKRSKNFSEIRKDFTIDYIPSRKNAHLGRFTFDIENGKYLNTIKDGKSNIDIMHQGLDYRISSAFENVTELKREEFVRKLGLIGVNYARVKIRSTFRFQFLEFSFTRVFEASQKANINQLMFLVKKDLPADTEELKSQALSFMHTAGFKPTNEIEIEVVDVPFLVGLLKGNYMGLCQIIDRYMRNAEILLSFPDEFSYKDYRERFGKGNNVEFPLIGEYLNENSSDLF
jgi:hypothetical protein